MSEPSASFGQALHAGTPASPSHSGFVFSTTTIRDEKHGRDIEVFKITSGNESIVLVPLRNWEQLDIHKWVPRGKLPESPPGLEVTKDHVKLGGEVVHNSDPEGCAKLDKIFAEWLAKEKETFDLARKHAQAKPAAVVHEEAPAAPARMHFQVALDKTGQPHVRCVQGKEVLAEIGLNQSGFKSLFSQGLMRKPHALLVGALHDWLELDGHLFSFEKGKNDSARLEAMLNEHYLPAVTPGEGKDIVMFANPASATGFDIQFPVMVAGVRESKRRPLNDETLELLQDPIKCGLLNKDIVIKLTRPNFVFKLKNPDGGERYLDSCPENMVVATDEDGREKLIDLSHPVGYSHLSTSELTAVFNHPAIHKHGKAATGTRGGETSRAPEPPGVPPPQPVRGDLGAQAGDRAGTTIGTPTASLPRPPEAPAMAAPAAQPGLAAGTGKSPAGPEPGSDGPPLSPPVVAVPARAPEPVVPPAEPPKPGPNAWLKTVLEPPPIRHDWFVCLVYSRMAEFVRSSSPGQLGAVNCWSIALGDIEDVSDVDFRGIFLTEKNGFGYLNADHIIRFNKGVVLLGTQNEAIEAIGVNLIAAGFDMEGRSLFVVSEGYRQKFGLPEPAVRQQLDRLYEYGAVILSVPEALNYPVPVDILWTVPLAQSDPDNPQPVESRNPEEYSQTAEPPAAAAPAA